LFFSSAKITFPGSAVRKSLSRYQQKRLHSTDRRKPMQYTQRLEKRTLTVCEATSIDVNNNTVIKQPKSSAGYRTLPIPEIVLDALYRHKDDDKVRVVPFSCASIYKRFKRALKCANLPDFRFHDMRHYYASVMFSLSVPDKYAMERMGQSTNSTLKNVYQHTMKNRQDEISAQLDAYFSSIK
ncbi:MAG: site-specific integrase, partial [Peptococcaceae bacterium]|nr:site-specific integrase [Peptococcaceae bacterium]